MQYPELLWKGALIGVCAPSDGVPNHLYERLEKAKKNVEALGYGVVETASVRRTEKNVSADAATRASEFMSLYEEPSVAAIIPPWGGEFLMDMLPFLDFERIAVRPPKWVCGYSDISTLTFAMTLCCDVATIHGSNFMNLGYARIHESDAALFTAMSARWIRQERASHWGAFSKWDIESDIYKLAKDNRWKVLDGAEECAFQGRVIGGCMDTLCKLIGPRYAKVNPFLRRYARDGFIWTLESCEMSAADIYRTLWQMRECGWFRHCRGILIGRPKGYQDCGDFTLRDALAQSVGSLGVPVLYDADIGHVPPLMQMINGAMGRVVYKNGHATVMQAQK